MTPRRIPRQHSEIVGLFGPRKAYAGSRRPWLLFHHSLPASLDGVANTGRDRVGAVELSPACPMADAPAPTLSPPLDDHNGESAGGDAGVLHRSGGGPPYPAAPGPAREVPNV